MKEKKVKKSLVVEIRLYLQQEAIRKVKSSRMKWQGIRDIHQEEKKIVTERLRSDSPRQGVQAMDIRNQRFTMHLHDDNDDASEQYSSVVVILQ